MANDINKESRKRKSASNLIFEVDEADISPSVTPEPNEKIPINSVSKTEVSSTDAKKIKQDKESEGIALKEKINISSHDLNGKLSPSNEPNIETVVEAETKTTDINESLEQNENNKVDVNEVNTDTMLKANFVAEVSKSDVDLRCMDMEVDNSPPPQLVAEKPFISVIFRDKDTALRAKIKLSRFIQNLCDFELNTKINPCHSDTSIDFWEYIPKIKTPEAIPEIKSLDAIPQPAISDSKPDNLDLFAVDTTPSKQHELLPRYTPTKITTIGEAEKIEKPATLRSAQSCFNCNGDHSIRDCKEVKNPRRIAMARNKFKSTKQNVRYHVDDELKYNHMVPGKISDELRRALDVRKHELPPYIYRMRSLGYPPGWLQEAMISNTYLELYDFRGCTTDDAGGEYVKKIDSNKVVEYPGFNAPLEKGFKDEFKYFNCPPYNEKHSKECMVQYIEQTAEKVTVKKVIRTINKPAPTVTAVTAVKETESDSNSQGSETTEKLRRSESPSLTDLELRKRQLLAELEDGSLNSPQTTNIDKQTNPLAQDIIESSSVVSSSFGTPIIKTESPYAQLPDRDKFSRDICQVINFENLPDSTGKYEQMTTVIDKVRKTVKNSKS